ncbi:glycoside hydrolase family 28 protein [Sinomicrobium weinanense]|uniref:Glycoside hydrolase family 28 protein n=1 Tax=Sinomicrobium weinanense TaxID=2842200 RepID=A0A926JU07_9FLAO|nr:glycoside hydrolase family 28 protein [Sinomicrobium weinanense]MBC9797217.1 glycoside hydrolase family 28 protein [Sinomicrobium weinanense]MBU3125570.1 glycoside hydrolase family 28 protein [Sinomicrobium weinanense]
MFTIKKRQLLAVSFALIMAFAAENKAFAQQAGIYDELEFKMPEVKEPRFSDYKVNIEFFGAESGGVVKNTRAFANAIDHVSEKGGGTVVIPRGMWLTGPITLKSNVELHAEEGALVIFSDDFSDYPLVKTSFEGLNTYRCMSPINGRNLENIAITGKGIFDGNGDAWRPVKKGKMTESQWKRKVQSGGMLSDDGKVWYPSGKSKKRDNKGNFNVPDFKSREEFETVKDYLRPVMLSLVGCKKVLLDGPTFQNSPAWNLHPLMCEDLTVRNLTVRNPWYSQNGDGLDLESCKNVVIYNNSFDVGDDAICFKSGKNKDGRDRGIPTENMIVTNNTVYHGHGGFVIGSEMSGGVKNVHVSNCTFIGTDVGLRFKSTRGRGGVVENIYISDIDMKDIPTEAIRFNMFYGGNSPLLEEDQEAETESRDENPVPVTEETPAFRNIYMKNITVVNSETAAFFMGLPEMKLKNVHLENAYLETKKGITAIDTDGLSLKNVTIANEDGVPLSIYNGRNIELKSLKTAKTHKPLLKIAGRENAVISIEASDITADRISYGNDEAKKAVRFKK